MVGTKFEACRELRGCRDPDIIKQGCVPFQYNVGVRVDFGKYPALIKPPSLCRASCMKWEIAPTTFRLQWTHGVARSMVSYRVVMSDGSQQHCFALQTKPTFIKERMEAQVGQHVARIAHLDRTS